MAKVILDDVQAAVAYLEAKGEPVSVVRVRNVLKRGSASTIWAAAGFADTTLS